MVDTKKQSFQNMLDYVHLYRLKNKLHRETADNDRKIRAIIAHMRDGYENRVDDYMIRNAELSKQRREIRQKMAVHKQAPTVKTTD
ncbi:Uncharacterized protein conserved in bacteria [[Haemophilus] ducreyi]|uniref:DUF496 family protein n=1 Tax=Haemophilus ducreyi TaxID=730 RepID=UPI000F6D6950|nr:DUF496 family protein [[Haemophilus] ducreyi]VEG83624.1 Uncharacterized protein conserved in bacteria [[Haemophilus] ducreyi]